MAIAPVLPQQVVPHDPHHDGGAEQETKPILQSQTTQKVPRSNKRASSEPGAGNRAPAAASFTGIFHSSVPNQENRTAH